MKLAIISDIHGNQIALDLVLKKIRNQQVDQIYFLGDAVNYYPDCNQVIEMLKKHDVNSIMGNHEFMIISSQIVKAESARVYKSNETKKELSKSNYKYIESLPNSITLEIETTKILMVHGSPLNEMNGYIYPDTDISALENIDFNFIFCGHTHRSMIRKIGNVTVANPGSVGMPRDIGNLASYMIFDSVSLTCEIKTVELPTDKIKLAYSNTVHPTTLNLLQRR